MSKAICRIWNISLVSRLSIKALTISLIIYAGASLTACSRMPFMSENRAYSRIFATDFSTAWTAALEAANNNRNFVDNHNRDIGTIDTKWIDNTEQKHFLEVFSNEDFFLRGRYRMRILVREGKKNDQQAVLIRIQKEQQLERTFLAGWETVESSGIEEAQLLYRIGRLLAIHDYNESLKDDDLKKGEPVDL
jgi:hypothetical protein